MSVHPRIGAALWQPECREPRAWRCEGWTAARRGVFDIAMRRFNQSWLLNPKNYRAFWGFGAVLSDKANCSKPLSSGNARQLIDDLARGRHCSQIWARLTRNSRSLAAEPRARSRSVLYQSQSVFHRSLENQPNFAVGWREWAISLYNQERYSEAWVKAQRAQELKAEPLPPEFLKKSGKSAQPK